MSAGASAPHAHVAAAILVHDLPWASLHKNAALPGYSIIGLDFRERQAKTLRLLDGSTINRVPSEISDAKGRRRRQFHGPMFPIGLS
jgi:hypothetical protein